MTDKLSARLPEARRACQRAAALELAEYLRHRRPQQITAERALIESSNDIALNNTAC